MFGWHSRVDFRDSVVGEEDDSEGLTPPGFQGELEPGDTSQPERHLQQDYINVAQVERKDLVRCTGRRRHLDLLSVGEKRGHEPS